MQAHADASHTVVGQGNIGHESEHAVRYNLLCMSDISAVYLQLLDTLKNQVLDDLNYMTETNKANSERVGALVASVREQLRPFRVLLFFRFSPEFQVCG